METFKIRIKLTNYFVTVVEKPNVDIHLNHDPFWDNLVQPEDDHRVRKVNTPYLYSEEEVNLLFHKYLDDHSILNTQRNHAIMDNWFNENKKK